MRQNTMLCGTPNLMPHTLEANNIMLNPETPWNAALYFFYTSKAADST